MTPLRTPLAMIALGLFSACSSSYADAPAPTKRPARADWDGYSDRYGEREVDRYVDDDAPRSPYRVEILGSDSQGLPTFQKRGRTYVLGSLGERYRIHVGNPTSRRIEAVVSVDGLDAIDGRTASFTDKRGYIIPAFGDVTIDGFRTSVRDVSTFRFSSVGDSYAGRKGQDRNVGVIGVAIFPERIRPIVRRSPPPPPFEMDRREAPSSEAAPPPPRSAQGAGGPAPSRSRGADSAEADGRSYKSTAPQATAPAPTDGIAGGRSSSPPADGMVGGRSPSPPADGMVGGRSPSPPADRPGLGTEFGEQRYSRVEFTRFERENSTSPSSIVEVRYNDRRGLIALGIALDAPPRASSCESCTRESADPFPGSRFAEPPPSR